MHDVMPAQASQVCPLRSLGPAHEQRVPRRTRKLGQRNRRRLWNAPVQRATIRLQCVDSGYVSRILTCSQGCPALSAHAVQPLYYTGGMDPNGRGYGNSFGGQRWGGGRGRAAQQEWAPAGANQRGRGRMPNVVPAGAGGGGGDDPNRRPADEDTTGNVVEEDADACIDSPH